jgi:hypothetical protein
MKTYELFTEAISAKRLAQLPPEKRKAAEEKMKADGLTPEEDKKSSAIVPTKGKITEPKGQLAKPSGFKPADVGGKMVRAKKNAIKHQDRVQKTKVKVHPPRPQRPGTSRTYDEFKQDDKKEEEKKKKEKEKKDKKKLPDLRLKKLGKELVKGRANVNPAVSGGTAGSSTLMKHTGGSRHF